MERGAGLGRGEAWGKESRLLELVEKGQLKGVAKQVVLDKFKI